MSAFLSEPSRLVDAPALLIGGDSNGNESDGQQHDRIQIQGQNTGTMAGSGGSSGTDITLGQRMVSATWGSILTSLLGTTAPAVKQTWNRP